MLHKQSRPEAAAVVKDRMLKGCTRIDYTIIQLLRLKGN